MSSLKMLESEITRLWADYQRRLALDERPPRAELEENLRVYSDLLQLQGSPRGELIALDVGMHGATSLKDRRDQLTLEWIGQSARRIRSRFGLLSVVVTEEEGHEIEFLLADCSEYLANVTIFGERPFVQRAVSLLASKARPWLGCIRVILTTGTNRPLNNFVLDRPTLESLGRSAPNVHTIMVSGSKVCADFADIEVVKVVADGYDCLGLLSGEGNPTTARVLDLNLWLPSDDRPQPSFDRIVVQPQQFPHLRKIDMVRNENPLVAPGLQPLRVLRYQSIIRQITHLRVPLLVTMSDCDALRALLTKANDLELLVVRRAYGPSVNFTHPTAKLSIPEFRPWPHPLTISSDEIVSVLFNTHTLPLPVRELAGLFDTDHDATLPEVATVMWHGIESVRHGREPTYVINAGQFAHLMRSLSKPLSEKLRRLVDEIETRPSGDMTIVRT